MQLMNENCEWERAATHRVPKGSNLISPPPIYLTCKQAGGALSYCTYTTAKLHANEPEWVHTFCYAKRRVNGVINRSLSYGVWLKDAR